jgi:hypothetical protein
MNAQFETQRKPSQSSLLQAAKVHEQLRPTAAGQSLDPLTRLEMEARFDHDFSGVRIHSDAGTGEAAQTQGASAYTVGQHIVFGSGRYAPRTPPGKQLLAHELAHVVQQNNPSTEPAQPSPEGEARRAAQRVAQGENAPVQSSVPPGSLQRDNGAEEEERRFRLRMPQLGESLGYRPRPLSLGEPGQFQLRLDPEIQAQIQAMQYVRGQLSTGSLESAIAQISTSIPTGEQAATAPDLSPAAAARTLTAGGTRPDPFSVPSLPPRQPLVPAGRGPETPRAAAVGDILQAVVRIPAVQAGITRLQDQASDRVRRDWSRLSGGERALVITQGIVMGAGALTGVALSPEARQLALDQIQGRDIPIPGLPVTFRFNLTGENQQLMIGVNVGELLPPSLGFR